MHLDVYSDLLALMTFTFESNKCILVYTLPGYFLQTVMAWLVTMRGQMDSSSQTDFARAKNIQVSADQRCYLSHLD